MAYKFQIVSNSNWDTGLFERPKKQHYPKHGYVFDTKKEFLLFVKENLFPNEGMEYLNNNSFYITRVKSYSGSKKNGSKVLF